MTTITIPAAKKLVKQTLAELRLPEHRLTGRTIDFTDLARGSCIFIKLHGWKPDQRAATLEKLARKHGFRVEFAGTGIC